MSSDSEKSQDLPQSINLNSPDLTDDQVVALLADEFDQFCIARHLDGAAQYGATGFMKNNMFQMIIEELADAANYIRYQYIKMRLLEGAFQNANSTHFPSDLLEADGHQLSHDASSFVGAGGLSELLQKARGFQNPGQRSE